MSPCQRAEPTINASKRLRRTSVTDGGIHRPGPTASCESHSRWLLDVAGDARALFRLVPGSVVSSCPVVGDAVRAMTEVRQGEREPRRCGFVNDGAGHLAIVDSSPRVRSWLENPV